MLDSDANRSDWVRIKVRDQAPGVPADMPDQLFEPFVRVGDSRGRACGGYGLGLAIAKRAIRLHGGQISANNDPDGNLIVDIFLSVDT
ncbi:MAG: hypothetical protein KDI88_13445 [Gammaproteobacteria bacterium]|nr:hypothetical protein [Gammaproteobacteria bacterium]